MIVAQCTEGREKVERRHEVGRDRRRRNVAPRARLGAGRAWKIHGTRLRGTTNSCT